MTNSGSAEVRNLYDSQGRFVGSLGRQGDGPGEFRRAVAAATFGADSVYLWDRERRLMTVLDRAGHQVRSFPVSANGFRLAAAPDGHFVLDGHAAGGNYGQPLNAFAPTGQLIAAFGEQTPRARFAPGPPVERAVTSDGAHGWWTVRNGYRYEIEHWDSALTRTAQFLPETDWFPVQRDLETPTRGETGFERLRPAATWIQVDSAGRLWIGGVVPKPGAQDALDRCIHGGEQSFPCLMKLGDTVFTKIVELRMASDGRLIAISRGAPAAYAMRPGLVFTASTDDAGFPHVTILRLRLRDRGGQ